MGLFGFNAEKKLAKGQEQLGKGLYYEARVTFEEIIVRDKVEAGIVSQARNGWRKARQELIDLQAAEAERFFKAGETREAIGCWQAIVELAGDDLDAAHAKEMLVRHGGETKRHEKLLEDLDSVTPVEALPDEVEEQGEYAPDDPAEIFEVYLQTLPEKQAEVYRSLGIAFRDGYLLIQEGKTQEALDTFAAADETAKQDPYFKLESAQALLLVERNEESLAGLDEIDPPAEVVRRVSEMRAILLERLKRPDEAEAVARRVWEEGKDADASILYAEILLDHGQFDQALEIVKPFVHPARPQPDIDRLAARAYAGLGRTSEVRDLLERAVEAFFQGPIGMRDAPPFPLWAARELMALYMSIGEPPEKIRSLVQHLMRHDPGSAEMYKQSLSSYARKLEEGDAAGDLGSDGDPAEENTRAENGTDESAEPPR